MNDMDNNNQHPLAGLYSGEILRYVVQALDIKDDVLDSRTARRFFAGEPKNEYNRSQIFEALGQALIQRDIAPESLDALPDGVSAAMAIGMAVGLVGERWDHLMATIQSRGTTVVDVSAVAERFLRLVAVDLAIRLFALNRLTGFPLPDPEPPLWAQENGGGHVLRRYLCQSGLTRRTLAARLGASYTHRRQLAGWEELAEPCLRHRPRSRTGAIWDWTGRKAVRTAIAPRVGLRPAG